MKGSFLRCLALTLILSMILGACGPSGASETDLTEGLKPVEDTAVSAELLREGNAAVTDFAVRLLQKTATGENENILLSPVSVMFALGMTANGAEGETLRQMEDVLGMSRADLNRYLKGYWDSLPDDEVTLLRPANALWLRESSDFSVNPAFLQEVVNWYDGSVHQEPFDDSTAEHINQFVSEQTKGKIPQVLVDAMTEDAVAYLVNALCFESEWASTYQKWNIQDGIFTDAKGDEQRASLMYGTEYAYLFDEKAQGFIKYFRNQKYAFAAILPNEDVNLGEYIASLEGKNLQRMLFMHSTTRVQTAMPELKIKYGTELSSPLRHMGMTDAFDIGTGDFSALGASENGNIYLSRVLHQTFLELGPKGAQAGAATVVEAAAGDAAVQEIKEVYLTRPFLFILMDCENQVPLFIGTVEHIEN